jgi:hypothetical protein
LAIADNAVGTTNLTIATAEGFSAKACPQVAKLNSEGAPRRDARVFFARLYLPNAADLRPHSVMRAAFSVCRARNPSFQQSVIAQR